MITNTGKGILAKYLIGQAPSYASYIAVGCGPSALNSEGPGFTSGQIQEYSEKKSLDFEMFRVPIISKGYVNENNITKLVLTAELPTEERYEITEIGVFSAEANPSAGAFDSKNFFVFTQTEGWKYLTSGEIPPIYTPLDGDNNNNIIIGQYTVNGVPNTPTPVFHTNSDNRIFTDTDRVERNERSRFLNNMIMIVGDNSVLAKDNTEGVVATSGNYIQKAESSFSFNRNAPTDKLKLAFSLINKNGDSSIVPDNVKILIRFFNSDSPSQYASFAVDIDHTGFSSGDAPQEENFASNRYFVVSKEIQDLYYTSEFNWNTANVARIYAQVRKDGAASSEYYVALDGMRLENLTTTNPLYGMTGYSVVKTDGALPIVKAPNTSNYIEFRIAVGVE
jgi:hypothetical protein